MCQNTSTKGDTLYKYIYFFVQIRHNQKLASGKKLSFLKATSKSINAENMIIKNANFVTSIFKSFSIISFVLCENVTQYDKKTYFCENFETHLLFVLIDIRISQAKAAEEALQKKCVS